MSGDFTTLAALRGGAPLLARVTTDCGGVCFWATTPAAADSSLAADAVVFYVAVQRAMASGATLLGNTRNLIAGRPPADIPRSWQRLAGGERALSTEYPFYPGVYQAGERLLAVNRAVAEDQAAVLDDSRVAELFRGLDFTRVDDRAGSAKALVEEIWRLFLAGDDCGDGLRGRTLPAEAPPQGRSRSVNTTHTLTFLWTPWSAFASVLLGLAAAGLCFAAWRRSGYRASMGLLELLRFVLVVLAALLLNQPEFVQEFRPKEKPSIAVLWDASPSMDTRDAASDDPAAAAPVSRRQAIAALTDASFWKELDERFDVVVQPFSGPNWRG